MQLNEHINDYLDYYCAATNDLSFAVLLKGEWGCGKTHLIRKYINGKKNYIHISLYGLSTFTEINEKILIELLPTSSKIKRFLSKTVSVIGSAIKLIPHVREVLPNNVNKIFLDFYLDRKNTGLVFIFDDLERSDIEISKLLGFINHLVEFRGHKVIIIANEEELLKLPSCNKYLSIKEKLIGKEFIVNSNPEEAIQQFIENIKNDSLIKKKDVITQVLIKIFFESNYNNLRLMKQAISSFEHFYSIIDNEIDELSHIFDKVIYEFIVIYIEFKKGVIKGVDFTKKNSFFKDISHEKEVHFLDKYENMSSHWLMCYDVEVLGNIMQGSSLNPNEKIKINERIRSLFTDREASWQKLWHFRELDGEAFLSLLYDVMTKWNKQEYTDFFIISHVFGVLLSLSEEGFIEETKIELTEQAKTYINKLIEDDNFPLNLNERSTDIMGWNDSAYGLSYHGTRASEWKEFMIFVDSKTKELRPQYIKEKIQKELLPVLRKGVGSRNDLGLLINYNFLHDSSGKGEAYFQYLQASEMKDILIQEGVASLSRYKSIFIQRYDERKGDIIDIEKENNFLIELKNQLEAEINNTNSLFGGRKVPKVYLIEAFISSALTPYITS
ncbi:MAG: P-loop NTPase fold protein [bacterium]|nr:P-loop NTPase fold protein [bacterium]